MEDLALGPLAAYLPIGALAAGLVAAARRAYPKIDGWIVMVALLLVSALLTLLTNGQVFSSRAAIDSVATAAVGFMLFNFARGAVGIGKSDPPAAPPGAPLALALLLVLSLGSTACGMSPRMVAIESATLASDLADRSKPVIQEKCITGLPPVEDPKRKARVDVCDVVVPGYDGLVVAIIATKAALFASVGDNLALLAAIQKLTLAVATFSADIARLIEAK